MPVLLADSIMTMVAGTEIGSLVVIAVVAVLDLLLLAMSAMQSILYNLQLRGQSCAIAHFIQIASGQRVSAIRHLLEEL